ncbi:hypothetical protein [Demequina sp. NBRC 110052]|uniref:hypothetical protein n=1 Tax=Demequina sp. NBRC 110052 TaxID=1570341 RepID=UPI0009FF99DE|nr:hypothetical protein [Demequina sp. NBRC 110052]
MSAAPLRRQPATPARPAAPGTRTATGRAATARAATAAAPARHGVGRAQEAPRREQAPRRGEHLRAVSAPEQARSLVPFVALCLAIIVAALGTVLMINIAMTEGAYERRDLKIEIDQLAKERSTLVTQLEANAAPSALTARASELGMVPADTLGVVSLRDSRVLESRLG